eukprot:3227121-Amphidinium_carterae.1
MGQFPLSYAILRRGYGSNYYSKHCGQVDLLKSPQATCRWKSLMFQQVSHGMIYTCCSLMANNNFQQASC